MRDCARPPGPYAVADPRCSGPAKHNNCFRIVPFEEHATAVADPRPANKPQFDNIYRVADWSSPTHTIISRNQPADGALSVADPRWSVARDNYYTAGHYGVLDWSQSSGAVSAAASHDNGPWSVADPRIPGQSDRLVAVIEALDGTWHRPFTTLELAALQSLIEPEEYLELDGLSDSAWRERIGNAVPPDAAKAIADTMAHTLLLAWSGESFMLSDLPIWVRSIAIALAVDANSQNHPSDSRDPIQ